MTGSPRLLLSLEGRFALGIVLLTVLAYASSLCSLYLFDDGGAVIDNPTIRHFNSALAPIPNGTPVSGRPLVNLTFAANYAMSGLEVWSYHATNLLIHVLAALALFSLVRRGLELSRIDPQFRGAALEIAGVVALLWAVHPLQTESVSYISQRAESLMGLFYFLTLDAFVRGVQSRERRWLVASVLACLAGMASKEVMVSAPLMVLLLDRTFIAGGFLAALKQRALYYAGLAATWLLLSAEMLQVGSRGGAVGTGLKIDSWHYALTQIHAVTLYLRLAFWPYPLTFDYGTTTVVSIGSVVPEAVLILFLLGVTVVSIYRRSALGFIGAWFFAILAPSSSIVPLAKQTMAEHRMYLPLAAVVMIAALLLQHVRSRARYLAILAVPLLVLTILRNGDYANGITIWSQSVARYPDNPRAHINLGNAYVNAGQPRTGAEQFEAALKLDPNLAEAHNNLGVVEAGLGEKEKAAIEYRAAMKISPGWPKPRENLDALNIKP